MTNLEKFKEVFGFKYSLMPYEHDTFCPFNRTKCSDYSDSKNFHCFEDCVKVFWESEYKEPKEKVADKNEKLFAFLDGAGQGILEGIKIAESDNDAKWKEAIEKIKADIEKEKNKAKNDETSYYVYVEGLTDAHETDEQIIDKHTKELM